MPLKLLSTDVRLLFSTDLYLSYQRMSQAASISPPPNTPSPALYLSRVALCQSLPSRTSTVVIPTCCTPSMSLRCSMPFVCTYFWHRTKPRLSSFGPCPALPFSSRLFPYFVTPSPIRPCWAMPHKQIVCILSSTGRPQSRFYTRFS
jgi:hypothetical protein